MVLTFVLMAFAFSLYKRVTNYAIRIKPHPYRTLIFVIIFVLLVLWWYRVMELVQEDSFSTEAFNPYKTLGLEEGESERSEIRRAYKKLAREYHPDKVG